MKDWQTNLQSLPFSVKIGKVVRNFAATENGAEVLNLIEFVYNFGNVVEKISQILKNVEKLRRDRKIGDDVAKREPIFNWIQFGFNSVQQETSI